ncbi:hypothetical protein AwPolaro_05940 [Polaromonas sp.]|nr:hypothetical protein AwPolaro_05940 [Polaromonas sp.]
MMLGITMKTTLRRGGILLLLALLQACASGPNARKEDPLEPLNRSIFNFNDGLDKAVIKPVATAYRDVTPAPVRLGVSSFFENLADVWSIANSLLQGKPGAALDSFFRVTTNTFWGVGGIFDVASLMEIPKHREDFGKTLGVWGVASGPYLVLPLLGPSSVRDAAGFVVDVEGSVLSQVDPVYVRNSLGGLRLLDTRTNFLSLGDSVDEAALDKYTFVRDVYLQRRQSLLGKEDTRVEERYDLPEVVPAEK